MGEERGGRREESGDRKEERGERNVQDSLPARVQHKQPEVDVIPILIHTHTLTYRTAKVRGEKSRGGRGGRGVEREEKREETGDRRK